MSTVKNVAIIALLSATTSAIQLDNQHKQEVNASSSGIFGKMIELATSGEKDQAEKHANTMRK